MPKALRKRIIFVDTNIFLDFYRSRGDSSLKLLSRLEEVQDSLITTYQVESEFLRNRQGIMLEFQANLSKCTQGVTIPAFLSEAATTKRLQFLLKESEKAVTRLHDKLLRAAESPRLDPVFKKTMPLFKVNSPFVLKRDNEFRSELKEKAQMRFFLGYPPRKNSDLSMGDALNWEWIIQCMKDHSADAVIVSRDADYGRVIRKGSKGPVLNDCLAHEAKERVGKGSKIFLTDRLTHGLELLNLKVAAAEKLEEESLVKAANISAQSGAEALASLATHKYTPSAELLARVQHALAHYKMPAFDEAYVQRLNEHMRAATKMWQPTSAQMEKIKTLINDAQIPPAGSGR